MTTATTLIKQSIRKRFPIGKQYGQTFEDLLKIKPAFVKRLLAIELNKLFGSKEINTSLNPPEHFKQTFKELKTIVGEDLKLNLYDLRNLDTTLDGNRLTCLTTIRLGQRKKISKLKTSDGLNYIKMDNGESIPDYLLQLASKNQIVRIQNFDRIVRKVYVGSQYTLSIPNKKDFLILPDNTALIEHSAIPHHIKQAGENTDFTVCTLSNKDYIKEPIKGLAEHFIIHEATPEEVDHLRKEIEERKQHEVNTINKSIDCI